MIEIMPLLWHELSAYSVSSTHHALRTLSLFPCVAACEVLFIRSPVLQTRDRALLMFTESAGKWRQGSNTGPPNIKHVLPSPTV